MAVDPNLLAKVSADRALGSAMLFPHRHPQASAPMHVEMFDLWRCADEHVLLEAFREAGKTTDAEEHLIMEGCFGNFNYCLLIGETYSKACQRLEALDRECRKNIKLHHLFGGLVLARKSIENRIWFKSGAMIEAWGWEQELQSFKYHEFRPDVAYLDDVENQERVRDKTAVDQSMRKLFLELIPAMDKQRYRIRIGQTRRAEDCMVTRLANNPDWLYRGYPICTAPGNDIDHPDAKPVWPSRYPMDWIRKKRDEFQRAGMLNEFLQVYMLQASNPDEKPFRKEMLSALEASPYHWMPRYVIYDPGRTSREKRNKEGAKSDRYGKVVVSRLGSQILIHESGGYHWKPNDLLDDAFLANEKHSPVKISIEKNSLDDWLMQPFRIEMLNRGKALPLHALQAPQDRSKDDFIMGLEPFARAKDIVLIGGELAHPQLVAEWLNFPKGPRDILNCLAYALRVFSGQPIYEDFGGANIADAPEPRNGETIYLAWNGDASGVVAVAVVREGQRLCVAGDWSAAGSDAVRTIAAGVRSAFPRASFSSWVPAETYDQWQRIPLVPALRSERITPYRGEHIAVARGGLSDKIRTIWRKKRLLTVDNRARLTLNALSSGYCTATERGGRIGKEPEPGVSKLIGEALECMVAVLDRQLEAEAAPAHMATTPGGVRYATAYPMHK